MISQETQNKVHRLIELIGFEDFRVENDEENKRLSITIRDNIINQENLPGFVLNVNRLVRLIAKNAGEDPFVLDINNYRREREGLIIKIARAAARKASVTGEAVSLPAMNSYERRIVHTELATRPDIETESAGDKHDRHVVVAPIEE